MNREVKKMSFNMCDETCPALDQMVYGAYDEICKSLNLVDGDREKVFNILLEDYLEKFKEVGTYLLRGALNDACENIIDLTDKIEELEYELKNS